MVSFCGTNFIGQFSVPGNFIGQFNVLYLVISLDNLTYVVIHGIFWLKTR